MTPTRRFLFLFVAALGLVNGGCLAVAAGCAAGGAAGYAYYQGRVAREYLADRDQVWTATNAALADLNMPTISSERNADSSVIESRSRDGEKVSILLDSQPPQSPGNPPLTRVSVRVGVFGDHEPSKRLLEQIAFHLVPARTAEPPLADDPTPTPATVSSTAPTVAPAGWRPTPLEPAPTKPNNGM